jgi:hypothetical protein
MRARAAIVVASAVVLMLLLASVLGLAHARHAGVGAAIRLIDGVAVGVQRTPAGALAAADNYVALASQSIEQDPSAFSALVAQAYAPETRDRVLSEAREVRADDAQNMSNYRQGGHGLAVIAARRLDSFTSGTATVTSWLGGLVWGPNLAPRQTWSLVETTLRWQGGRWLIVTSSAAPTPAPVPSIVYVDGANDRSSAFARLAGMTAPFYGAPE